MNKRNVKIDEALHELRKGFAHGSLSTRVFVRHADHLIMVESIPADEIKVLTRERIQELVTEVQARYDNKAIITFDTDSDLGYGYSFAFAVPTATPGAGLARLTQLFITAEAHRLFIQPAIADMQVEYADARKAKQSLRALSILVRGYMSVLPCWLYGLLSRTVKRLFSA